MATKDVLHFTKVFEKQIRFNKLHLNSNIGYGENVMPVLEIYESLSEFSEQESFRDTIVKFLEDTDLEKRNFAINLCLGFLVFQDSIGR